MRPRLTFFLLVLVVLPLVLLAWVGQLLWVGEQDRWQEQWKARIAQQLQGREQNLKAQVQAVGARFSGLLASVTGTDETLRELTAAEPLVRHAFSLNEEGKFLVPGPSASAAMSSQDLQFLTRTAAFWSSGRRLGRVQSGEAAGLTFAAQGWQVWYAAEGPEFLYWQHTKDGRILGIEVERAAFLAALLSHLPSASGPGCTRLTAADGGVLYHEGAFEPGAQAVPALSLSCSPPLHHWHWEYFTVPGLRTQPPMWPYLLGFTGVAALFAAISLLVFTTYRRHMRQAAQRVSFVNQVSHELKTPLTNIRLYTDLARASVPPEGTRYLDVVEEEASRLSRLIHNVLTFARQDREQLEVHAVSGDLNALLSRVIEAWRPALQRKNIPVSTNMELQQQALFDADATEQILGNLFSNIEKYAANATQATVSLSAHAGFAELRITDNGPGIPAKAARRLFQPFYRARSDLTEGVSGTGLGLSIARGLAVAQGGTLEYCPASKGACFVLRLPLAEEADSNKS